MFKYKKFVHHIGKEDGDQNRRRIRRRDIQAKHARKHEIASEVYQRRTAAEKNIAHRLILKQLFHSTISSPR